MDRNHSEVTLTVVIACRDAASHLGAQLDALARQAFGEPWEVVVADNGSTDGSQELALRYRDRLPIIRVIDASQRPGAAYARNIGVSHARGEAVLFVDADDVVGDDYVATMAAALESEPLVCSRLDFTRLNPAWVVNVWPRLWQTSGPLHEFDFLPFAGAGTLGIRKSLFEEVGGFDAELRWYEEADLCWRIQLAGGPTPAFVSDAVLHIRLPRTLYGMYQQAKAYGVGDGLIRRRYPQYALRPRQAIDWRTLAGALRRTTNRTGVARLARTLGVYAARRAVVPGNESPGSPASPTPGFAGR